MTSRLHFELFMQHLRASAPAAGPQFLLGLLRQEAHEDVGTVRLSHIEAAIKEARADRPGE